MNFNRLLKAFFPIAICNLITMIAFPQSLSRDFVNAPEVQKSGAYSHAIILEQKKETIIMTSGIIGTDKSGTLVVTNSRAQIHQTFENIRAILAATGVGINDIIEIETFLVDTANFLDYALERRYVKGLKFYYRGWAGLSLIAI